MNFGMGYQQYEFDRFCATLENVREFTGEMLELIAASNCCGSAWQFFA